MGRVRHPGARRKDPALECHWGESTRSREVAARQRFLQILQQWCGGDPRICHHIVVASKCWGPLLATRILCAPVWRCSAHIITHCWRAFPWSRTCSRRGCIWFTAHLLGRTMWLEVEPQMAAAFCQRHDAGVWECLCRILHVSPEQGDDVVGAAFMPLVLGGIGLRSACRGSTPAFWASWADTLPVIAGRHPLGCKATGR